MGRDPLTSPAERTAQAMRKMTPGVLAGASRIATPGRTPSRAKRIPTTTAPPTTALPQYLATNGFDYDESAMGWISTDHWLCTADVDALSAEMYGTQASGNPLWFGLLMHDTAEGPESLVPSYGYFEGGGETYLYQEFYPAVHLYAGNEYWFQVSPWDLGTGLGPSVFTGVMARIRFDSSTGVTDTVTWTVPP